MLYSAQILLVEDDSGDARFLQLLLKKAPHLKYEVEWVQRLADALERLGQGGIQLTLLDLGLPDSQGMDTFDTLHERFPDIPVVVLSGLEDEETAVMAVARGAQDYLPKKRLAGWILIRSIQYALERHKLMQELRQALARVRTLSGLLPICANCKNVRDDKGYWQRVEEYISERSEASFTHGLCPDCLKALHPEIAHRLETDHIGLEEFEHHPAPASSTTGADSPTKEDRTGILLVDDEAMVRDTLGEMLRILGYRVLSAEDGIEATMLFKNHKDAIHAVILDMNLPGTSGEQVMETFRSLKADTPIVMCSGLDETEVKSRFQNATNVYFLPKPFTIERLKETLEKMVEIQ